MTTYGGEGLRKVLRESIMLPDTNLRTIQDSQICEGHGNISGREFNLNLPDDEDFYPDSEDHFLEMLHDEPLFEDFDTQRDEQEFLGIENYAEFRKAQNEKRISDQILDLA
jgi:hypothetical protein